MDGLSTITEIAIAVIRHGNRVLVGRRPDNAPLGGLWEFPGGKIKAGESPQAAAVRECLEETSLEVLIESLLHTATHRYEHDHVRLHFFNCRLTGSRDTPHAPFQWVAMHQLALMEFPAANRDVIRRLLRHESRPE